MNGYEALRCAAASIDLSARGKLRVTGEDRARLLHAMSANHIQDLAPHDGLYAFFLTAHGRILADAYVYNLGESFLLDTEPETAGKLRDHLDKYIIADDVTLEDETAQWAAIAIEGPASADAAVAIGAPVPSKKYSVEPWSAGFVARVASTGPEGIRIFIPSAEKTALLSRLGIPAASAEEARLVRLENGIPRYGEDISERYLVQETQQLHAIHTNKGCYLGQEIVERVRSRGQVHRLLTPVRIHSRTPPQPGTKLTSAGNPVAEITSAAYSPALGEVVALAYVRTEVAHARPEMVVAGSDPQVLANCA
ncbi:MAG: folate-binding protein YgfZ [Acidobacteriaceae bacterium]|nr:folate-binding protein YgfZ [Acidobacteriaceae bacterium]